MPAPTPSELAQLEHSFATDPNSDSYRPLAEAYLSMGRFMEAMVVCKKGVKAHPDRPDPRVLLARVYAEQGKDRKALDELEGAITAAPTDAGALRMAAGLLLKTGENDKGKDYALRAFKAAPSDAETKELLEKWKIEPPAAAPAPRAVVAPPPASELVEAAEPARNGAVFSNADPVSPSAPQGIPPGYQNGQSARAPQGVPPGYAPQRAPAQTRPAQRAPQRSAPARRPVDLSQFEEPEDSMPHRAGGNSGMVTLGFAVLAVVALVGLYFYKKHAKEQGIALAADLHQALEQLDHDSYASYKRGSDLALEALKIDPDQPAANADLAYAYVIRWGEHGEGQNARQQAQNYLARAMKLDPNAQHVIAANALMEFFSGNAPKAEEDLQKQVASLEEKAQASDLVYSTLGIIEMRNGDLEKASVHLKKALELNGGSPRIHAAIGDLYRRQGQEILAWTYYDNALRYEHDHADAVLGKSLLVLEAQNPNYKIAEDLIKRVRDAEPPPSPRQLAMAYMLDAMRLDQVNQKDEGMKQEQKALALDDKNPEIHVLVGRRMLKEGQAEKGLAEIQKAIQLDPKRASFYVELARAQMALPKGAKDAIASLQTALKTLPNSAKLLQMLGDAYLEAGDAQKAQETYEKAIKTDPKAQMPQARLALAEMARRSKDYGKAGELYAKAEQEFGNNTGKVAEVLADEALLAQDKGEDKGKVMDLLKKSNQADQNYAPTYIFMARLLGSDKHQRAAVRQLGAQYLKLDPKGSYAAEAQRWANAR